MKKAIILFSLISLCVIELKAQKKTKKFSVGFGIEAGLPTGSTANAYNMAAGLTLRFSYPAGPGFVTLTTGGIVYGPKKIAGQSEKVGLQIPVRAGYKYIIHHFFVMGEVGYAVSKTYYGSQGAVQSVSQGSFIAAPSLGIQFNAFEASLRYGINFSDQGGVVGLRLGFNF